MIEIAQFTSLIEREIQQQAFPKSPENLYDPLSYFLQLGGKRLRPSLTLMGANLFKAEVALALPAALSVEYFHNFTLIHDDIMDEAPLRRSQATVHEKWNTNIAILSGDVLLVKAYQQLSKQDVKHVPALYEVFNKTAVEVCEGQQMDMDFEANVLIDKAAYLEMIRLKTSVLLGCALELGAIIADASETDRKKLYNFGVALGMAFQIQDDLLDLYADPEKFGKQVGGDVIANKKTLLRLVAMEIATADQKRELQVALALKNPQEKVEAVRAQFDVLGVKQEVLKLRDAYFSQAEDELGQIQAAEESKIPLRKLMDFLREREV